METDDLTYYDMLEVGQDATVSQIRKAYLKQAAQWHPDKCLEDPDAKETFQLINEAYHVLSDPKSRSDYDRKLEIRKASPPVRAVLPDPPSPASQRLRPLFQWSGQQCGPLVMSPLCGMPPLVYHCIIQGNAMLETLGTPLAPPRPPFRPIPPIPPCHARIRPIMFRPPPPWPDLVHMSLRIQVARVLIAEQMELRMRGGR